MKFLRKFNESFNSDDYLDYLLSEVEEKSIEEKYVLDNLIFLILAVDRGQADKIEKYLNQNQL